MQIEKKPFKSGDSLAIIIPKYYTTYFEINENTIVIIEDDEDKLTIRKR